MAEIYHVKWKAGIIADCTISDDFDWMAGRFLEVCKKMFGDSTESVSMSMSDGMIIAYRGNTSVMFETIPLKGREYHEDD